MPATARIAPRPNWGPPRRGFHDDRIGAIVARDGRVVTLDDDGVLLWTFEAGALSPAPVSGFGVTRRGAVLRARTASADHVIALRADGADVVHLPSATSLRAIDFKKAVKAAALARDGSAIVTCTSTGHCDVYAFDGKHVGKKPRKLALDGVKKAIALDLSPDAERIAVSGAGGVGVHDLGSGARMRALSLSSAGRVAFASEEIVLVFTGDALLLWRWNGDQAPAKIDGLGYVHDVAPSGANDRVAIACASGVLALDLAKNEPAWLTGPADAVAWLDDAAIVAGKPDGTIAALPLAGATRDPPAPPRPEPHRFFRGAALAPDGSWLAIAHSGDDMGAEDPYAVERALVVHDTTTGERRLEIVRTDDRVRVKSGFHVVLASGPDRVDWYDETLTLAPDLRSATPAPRRSPEAHDFTADGRRFVTWCEGEARVVDAGTVIARFAAKGDAFSFAGVALPGARAYIADERVIVQGSEVTAFEIGREEPLAKGRIAAGESLYVAPTCRAWLTLPYEVSNSSCTGRFVHLDPKRDVAWTTYSATLAAALSPDGALVVTDTNERRHLAVRRCVDGQYVAFLEGLWVRARALFFHPSGKAVFAVASDGFVMRWDLERP